MVVLVVVVVVLVVVVMVVVVIVVVMVVVVLVVVVVVLVVDHGSGIVQVCTTDLVSLVSSAWCTVSYSAEQDGDHP